MVFFCVHHLLQRFRFSGQRRGRKLLLAEIIRGGGGGGYNRFFDTRPFWDTRIGQTPPICYFSTQAKWYMEWLWFDYFLQEQLNGNLLITPFQLTHIKMNLWIINCPPPTNLWPLTELRESLKHENREWQQFLGSLGSSDETLWPCLQPIFISFLTCVVTQTCIDPCRKMTSTVPI